MTQTFVLSLGGSLIVPDEIDVEYLKKFKALIERYVSLNFRFVIVTGGGKVCRKYQQALTELIGDNQEGSDWMGISLTHVNAQLVKGMFSDVHPEVIMNPTNNIDFKENILVAGGWKPGFSSDMDAVLLAKKFGASTVINLSNIDYVYDKDPKYHDNAQKIENISWHDFRKIVGDKWVPGSHLPFDPVASKEAAKAGLKVVIMNGSDLESLENIFKGQTFKGTRVS
ncbi:UMP kinase [archaeon]|nr:UMP kinase [archaeon]MBL7057054.1 UMP kinase [Candidatus Woesearchaeota archaeon]